MADVLRAFLKRWRDLPPQPRYLGILGLVAAVLGIVFLLAPPMGTDLSAQVARADFVRDYGTRPLDLRWYAGTSPYAYSLVSPWVMAVLGARLTGVLAAAASTVLLGAVLWRTQAQRLWLAGLLGAVGFYGNLVSGRVTWAAGVAFGLAAVLLLTRPAGRPRLAAAGGVALLASATSPVAGLFLGLVGMAGLIIWWVGRRRRERHVRVTAPGTPDPDPTGTLAAQAAPVLIVAALLPMLASLVLFPQPGWMNISGRDVLHASISALVVAFVVPSKPIRVAAVLAGLGVLASWAIKTPVGLNSTRLITMFALPVLAGYASSPPWLTDIIARSRRLANVSLQVITTVVVVAGLAVMAWWQPPLMTDDLRDRGNESASASYYAPLLAELAARKPEGRIEVPPTRDYWESAYVARQYPLARGWLRQVDLDRNPLFFSDPLVPDEYRDWLTANGVQYVAVPDTELSWVASREIFLIGVGQPYLTEVWRGEHWTLYEVQNSPRLVDGATLVSTDGAAVTFAATTPNPVRVRVRWSDWLTLSGPAGACLAEDDSGWTIVQVAEPGTYTLSSGTSGVRRCPPES